MMTSEEYLTQRVDSQIAWYSSKSASSKQWYIRLQMLTIVFSVSIPFVSNFMTDQTVWVKHIVSFMGLTIAAVTGFLSLMKYRELWIEYRATSEILKHERYMYLTRSGAYSGKDRFKVFVQTIEDVLSKEVANWKTYQYKKEAVEENEEPEETGVAPDVTRVPKDIAADGANADVPPVQ